MVTDQDDSEAVDPEPETDQVRLEGDVPPIDFNTFIISLSTSALAHMAEGPGPQGLALARQTIDLIALLEEKTSGNLTGEEERILSQVLFDLRMRYVAHAKGQ